MQRKIRSGKTVLFKLGTSLELFALPQRQFPIQLRNLSHHQKHTLKTKARHNPVCPPQSTVRPKQPLQDACSSSKRQMPAHHMKVTHYRVRLHSTWNNLALERKEWLLLLEVEGLVVQLLIVNVALREDVLQHAPVEVTFSHVLAPVGP